MILSKYFHSISIDNVYTAIFNSLILEPLFVKRDEFDSILRFDVSEEDKRILLDKGIYTLRAQNDINAINILKRRYTERCYKIETLYLCVSDFCNLSCDYCYVKNGADMGCELRLMTNHIADIALEKWLFHLETTPISAPTIVFYGGEPLLNMPLIEYVVKRMEKAHFDVRFQIVSNGTLINDSIIDFIKEHDIEIGISIDGPPCFNDKHRYYPASNSSVGKIVEENILKCLKNNCDVGLSVALTEDVINNQDDTLRWLKTINVPGVYFNILQSTPAKCYSESYYRRANAFLQHAFCVLSPTIKDGNLLRKVNSFYNSAFKLSNCSAVGVNQLTITSDGDVCVCQGCMKIKRHSCGNIMENSLADILSSDLSTWILHAPILNEKCQSCDAIFICGGGCPLEAEALTNTTEGTDWPFCIHSQSSLEWLLKDAYTKRIV